MVENLKYTHYDNSNPYEGGKIPPCSAFLNNTNPIIKDGKIIYRNLNRVFCFLSTVQKAISSDTIYESDTSNKLHYKPFTSTNLQISLTTYIIGLYINQIQNSIINYSEDTIIHSNETANKFIHELLQRSPNVNLDCTPKLSFIYSNTNAILPLVSNDIEITALNYYILFILNRLENEPGLFFGNNSFATTNPINLTLSGLYLEFPF
jgi:hypothetical protein